MGRGMGLVLCGMDSHICGGGGMRFMLFWVRFWGGSIIFVWHNSTLDLWEAFGVFLREIWIGGVDFYR